jgi:hypothetical protein
MRIGSPGTGRVVRHSRTELARREHEVLADPATTGNDMAEPVYQRGVGIDVVPLWHRVNGELTVSVTDAASGASFELPVVHDEAFTAFHPYAYTAVKGVTY